MLKSLNCQKQMGKLKTISILFAYTLITDMWYNYYSQEHSFLVLTSLFQFYPTVFSAMRGLSSVLDHCKRWSFFMSDKNFERGKKVAKEMEKLEEEQLVDMSKDITMKDIEKLFPYHNNPKEHPQKQIDKIASSIKNYGFIQPLVIDSENEVIIGHGRLEASKKLGLKKVPVVVKDDLTEAQIRALRIADNRVAESSWNMEQLAEEFELLELDDIELEMTGFEMDEIEGVTDDFPAVVDNSETDNTMSQRTGVGRTNVIVSVGRMAGRVPYEEAEEMRDTLRDWFQDGEEQQDEKVVNEFVKWFNSEYSNNDSREVT